MTEEPLREWQGKSHDYERLRQTLNTLEYTEYLPPEAFPLVQRLVADLLQTTKTSKALKNQVKELEHQVEFAEQNHKPVLDELARQTAQQNELHLELIKQKDSMDLHKRTSDTTIRKLQNKIYDLQFMNSYLGQQLQEKDSANDAFKNKINDFVIDSKQSKKLFNRIQKIDLETGLEPVQNNGGIPKPDPVMIDFVKLAELEKSQLQQKNSEYSSMVNSLQFDLETLTHKLQAREEYIDKLSTALQISRQNGPNLNTKMDLPQALNRISVMESQIVAYNEHIQNLEQEVEVLEDKKMLMQSAFVQEAQEAKKELLAEQEKSRKLLGDLEHLEHMLKDLEAAHTNTAPPVSVKNSKKIADLETKIQQLLAEKSRNEKRLAMLQKDVIRLKSENKKHLETVDSLQSKLKVLNQPECVKELKRPPTFLKDPKGSAEKDQKKGPPDNEGLNEQFDSLTREIKVLQTELLNNHKNYTSEVKDLKDMQETLIIKNEHTERSLNDLKIEKTQILKSLDQVTSERDTLLDALENFEQSLTDVNERAKRVTEDRDSLSSLYKQLNEEVIRLRRASGENQKAKEESKSAERNDTQDIQGELQAARVKISQLLDNEKNFVTALDKANAEIENLKQDIREMCVRQRDSGVIATEAVIQIDKELASLKVQLNDRNSELQKATLEIQQLKESLARAESASIECIAANEKLTQKQADADLTKTQLNLQIRDLKSKLSESEREIGQLRKQVTNHQKILEDKERMLGDQRGLIAKIDAERDKFISQLDEKTENMMVLKDENKSLQKSLTAAESKYEDMVEQVQILTGHLNQRDKQCLELEKQMASLSSKCNHLEAKLQEFGSDNQKLGSDLVVVTRENQILNNELLKISSQCDKFHHEITENEEQIQKLNDFIKSKDEEKQQLLINYRKLIMEHEKMDQVLRNTTEESNSLRMQLLNKDKMAEKLRADAAEINQQLNQLHVDNSALEKQYTSATRSLSTAERKIKQLENEFVIMERQVHGAREFAHTVDKDRDDTKSRMMNLSIENERLQRVLENMNIEKSALEKQVQSEKLKGQRLEEVLNSERKRNMYSEQAANEMQATKGILEAQLQELTVQQELVIKSTRSALESSINENKALKQQIVELEQSLAQKKRDIQETPQKNRVEDDIERELLQTRSAKKGLDVSASASNDKVDELVDKRNPLDDKVLSTLVQSRIEQQQREDS